MNTSNIKLGENVDISRSADINNIHIGDNVLIRRYASVFGAPTHPAIIGKDTKISIMAFLNGWDAQLILGDRCTISRNVHIITGSGPMSSKLSKAFPAVRGPVTIGNDCWIGAECTIMPNVTLGEFCIVATNSTVKESFPAYSIIGGNPAKLIRTFTEEEIKKVHEED